MDGTCFDASWFFAFRVDNYILSIFAEFIHIGTQIPWDHPWHQRLATLLNALRKQPAPPKEVVEKYAKYNWLDGEFTWEKLLTFRTHYDNEVPLFFETRDEASLLSQLRDDWTPLECLNINRFFAVLVVADLSPFNTKWYANCGLQVLRNTLEVGRDVAGLERDIPPAAVWIITAGKWFHEKQGPELKSELSLLEGETCYYKGPDGLSDERWTVWEERFKEYLGRSDLSDDAREWATKAVVVMAGLK